MARLVRELDVVWYEDENEGSGAWARATTCQYAVRL